MRPLRIALFGGTFDPIHAGHLKSAAVVGRRFELDRILFVPASIPPHKARAGMAPASDRYRMVRLAVAGHPGWSASPVEIRAGGTSYSIRTIERMRLRFPRAVLFFIAGADAFRDIKTWRLWERVLRKLRLHRHDASRLRFGRIGPRASAQPTPAGSSISAPPAASARKI